MPLIKLCEGDLVVIDVPEGGFVIAVVASDGEGNLGVSWGDVYMHPRPALYLSIQRECLKPGAGLLIGSYYTSVDEAEQAVKPCLLPGQLFT